MLASIPDRVAAVYPSEVNIRFTTNNLDSTEVKVVTIKQTAPSGKALGKSFDSKVNFPNMSPSGWSEIYVANIRDDIALSCCNYLSDTNANKYISSIPLECQQYINIIANTIVHEVGHALGLVMPKYLSTNISDMHNRASNPLAVMRWSTPTVVNIQSPSLFLWLPLEDEYLYFILPTP